MKAKLVDDSLGEAISAFRYENHHVCMYGICKEKRLHGGRKCANMYSVIFLSDDDSFGVGHIITLTCTKVMLFFLLMSFCVI